MLQPARSEAIAAARSGAVNYLVVPPGLVVGACDLPSRRQPMTEGVLTFTRPNSIPSHQTAAAKIAAESEPAGLTGEHTHHGSVHGYTH